jgi:hypothetical protein
MNEDNGCFSKEHLQPQNHDVSPCACPPIILLSLTLTQNHTTTKRHITNFTSIPFSYQLFLVSFSLESEVLVVVKKSTTKSKGRYIIKQT